MKLIRLFGFVVLFCLSSSVFAQATRTWVSGVGDDANPCSRSAPCKTFAGAISKTAARGEINVLDPGGFGGVTITKSITISSEGFEAGVLVSGTNAIVVNAAATDVVVLRGLDIEGIGTGLSGIRFLAGGALYVENCTINNFRKGIDFVPSNVGAKLFVTDSVVRNCTTGPNANDGGILVAPTPTGSATAMIFNTVLEKNRFGLRVEEGARVTARDTISAGNQFAGFSAVADAIRAELRLEHCIAANNQNGVRANGTLGGTAEIHISEVAVLDNSADGLVVSGTGSIISFSNNRLAGNSPNGNPTNIAPQQ